MARKAKCKYGRRIKGYCPPKRRMTKRKQVTRPAKRKQPAQRTGSKSKRRRGTSYKYLTANQRWAEENGYSYGGSSYSEKTVRPSSDTSTWRDYVIRCKPGTGDRDGEGTTFRAKSASDAKDQAVKFEAEQIRKHGPKNWTGERPACRYDLSTIKEVPLTYFFD